MIIHLASWWQTAQRVESRQGKSNRSIMCDRTTAIKLVCSEDFNPLSFMRREILTTNAIAAFLDEWRYQPGFFLDF
ncbi:hypothetical protein QUA56_21925 [Microcoleus sp. N3A4]|uniref:hypothetical protein n=1 Tax=Microcoleus sp. N3A4 TaxID=3055379 RepID=UPI002FCED033